MDNPFDDQAPPAPAMTPHEAVDAYCGKRGLSLIAEQLGLHHSTIARMAGGERELVNLDVARDIERVSGGRITASQWLELCLAARTAREAEAERGPVESAA
jgi:hypothetical protein